MGLGNFLKNPKILERLGIPGGDKVDHWCTEHRGDIAKTAATVAATAITENPATGAAVGAIAARFIRNPDSSVGPTPSSNPPPPSQPALIPKPTLHTPEPNIDPWSFTPPAVPSTPSFTWMVDPLVQYMNTSQPLYLGTPQINELAQLTGVASFQAVLTLTNGNGILAQQISSLAMGLVASRSCCSSPGDVIAMATAAATLRITSCMEFGEITGATARQIAILVLLRNRDARAAYARSGFFGGTAPIPPSVPSPFIRGMM